jgi:hypothetical protein
MKLSSLVGGDDRRYSEAGNPVLDEETGDGLSRNIGQRNSFRPARKSVNAGKQVAGTI